MVMMTTMVMIALTKMGHEFEHNHIGRPSSEISHGNSQKQTKGQINTQINTQINVQINTQINRILKRDVVKLNVFRSHT